jgi:hypothetical protein
MGDEQQVDWNALKAQLWMERPLDGWHRRGS